MAFRFVEPVLLAVILILPDPGAAARVVTVKVPEVEPAVMVIVAGTVPTEVLLLERLTTNPSAGAGPEIVTVPVDGSGCVTVVGLSVRLESVGGFTVRVALLLPPPVSVAEMIAVDAADTGMLVTVNVVELLPEGTVTELTDRVATAVLLFATLTTIPPVGAVVFRVTVAVDVAPPITLLGFSASEEICGGFTVRTAVRGTPSI